MISDHINWNLISEPRTPIWHPNKPVGNYPATVLRYLPTKRIQMQRSISSYSSSLSMGANVAKGKTKRTSATDKAIQNILKWADREEWAADRNEVIEAHFAPACKNFDLSIEELEEEIGPEIFGTLLGFATEDFLTRPMDPEGRTVIDDYLKRRGWAESWPGKCYLTALRGSVPSLYEIVDLEPGSHLVLNDLVLEGPLIRVEERLGSKSAAKWDKLGARVLHVDDKNLLAGGLLLFSFEAAESILRVLRKALKGTKSMYRKAAKKRNLPEDAPPGAIQHVFLSECAPAFSRIWLMHTLADFRQPLPSFTNFDGEKLLFSEVRFPLIGSMEEAEECLDAAEELAQASETGLDWVWLRQETQSKEAAPREKMRDTSFGSFAEGGSQILGNLELHEGELILSVNSAERAERGRDFLAQILGDLVGAPLTSYQTPEQALEQNPKEKPEGPKLDPEEAARLVQKFKDEHYRKVLSEPIPMLGDKNPRQAAHSKAGREKVLEWLKLLENNEARQAKRSGEPPYDSSWMWEELKLNDLHH